MRVFHSIISRLNQVACLLSFIICSTLQASGQEYYSYTIESLPQSIIATTTGYVVQGTYVQTPNISYGATSGYYFGYWTVNGVRQAGVTGAALTSVTLDMTNNVTAVAVFLPVGDSIDSGLQDWYQWFWFGKTNQTSNSDPTGDGFFVIEDILRDYSPVIANVTTNGGAILRLSDSMTLVPTKSSKQTPIITTVPTASNITYGQALSNCILSGGVASVAGSFAFATPSANPGVGTALQIVTFTPTDTADYNTAGTNVNVTVSKATPTITTTPTASTISYGQALSSSTLLGGVSSVPGSFAFTTPAKTPDVGTASQSVTFTPADTNDYNTVAVAASVTVNRATPIVIWSTPAPITSGTALSSIQLNATADIPGSFTYYPGIGTVPGPGTNALFVTFSPSNSLDYISYTDTVRLVVNATVEEAAFILGIAPATHLIWTNLQVGGNYQLQELESGMWVDVGSPLEATAALYASYVDGAGKGLSYHLEALPVPATAMATPQVAYGFVVGVTLINGGYGYTTNPSVTFVGGGGSGAKAVTEVSNALVTEVNMVNAGSGYTSTPVVIITPPSAQTSVLDANPNPAFRIDCSGLTAGATYQLMASSFLGGWTNFAPAFSASSSTNSHYFDAPSGNAFFRLRNLQ